MEVASVPALLERMAEAHNAVLGLELDKSLVRGCNRLEGLRVAQMLSFIETNCFRDCRLETKNFWNQMAWRCANMQSELPVANSGRVGQVNFWRAKSNWSLGRLYL